jgi:hypothetical protein
MLLAGLLTRAVLEGYLTAGWTGPEAVDRLLTLEFWTSDSGGSMAEKEDAARNEGHNPSDDKRHIVDEFEEFDPDEMPSLEDALKVLFSPSDVRQRKDGPAKEFEADMEDRLRKACFLRHSSWPFLTFCASVLRYSSFDFQSLHAFRGSRAAISS